MSQEEALAALASLITRRKRADASNWGDAFSLMETYLQMLDLDKPLSRLSVIHVAGTKGKGSTCAFSESILRAHGFKTGMFTSPHLIDVRERFRLNGKEVEDEIFLKHFWSCYNRLQEKCTGSIPMPAYFRFLTLLAFRIFTEEKVEVALVEVGIGGRYDATNVVKEPMVCGVSSLGYDHMELLGNTLGEIAGEKAGIFKANVPAVTSPQPGEAMIVLQNRAKELQIPLEIATSVDDYLGGVKLGLGGCHQKLNASLAVSLCKKWTERSGFTDLVREWDQAMLLKKLPGKYIRGLEEARWPGRAQILRDPTVEIEVRGGRERGEGEGERDSESRGDNLVLFLDGAHTPESMEVCANWFCEAVNDERPVGGSETLRRILLFNCMPERDPSLLLPPLISVLRQKDITFQRAMVVPSLTSYSSLSSSSSLRPFQSTAVKVPPVNLAWQLKIQRTWEALRAPNASESEIPLSPLSSLPSNFLSSSGPQYYTTPLVEGGEGERERERAGCVVGPTSAVVKSLPSVIDYFRRTVREHPTLRLQVLVTGSLHLVGDVLRLMKH